MNESCIVASLIEDFPDNLPPNIARLIRNAPESFDDQRAGIIAVAIKNLQQRSEAVNIVSVRNALPAGFDKDFLRLIQGDALPVSLAEMEAATIWAAFQTRQAKIATQDIAEALQAAPKHTASIIAAAQKTFSQISSDVGSGVRGELLKILTSKEPTESKRSKAAQIVVSALNDRGRFYFHTERRDFDTTMFFDSERKRLEKIRSDSFKSWLSDWLCVNRADGAFAYIAAAIETAALSGDSTTGILPDAFWTSRNGAVYISNGDGQIVKITNRDVSIVDNGTDGIIFPTSRTLKPWRLVEPVSPFESMAIFRDAHCAASHGKDLLHLIAYSLPTNPKTKPAACFSGSIGSGKTRTAKAVAELFGLPQVISKVEESGEDDFWPTLDAGGLVILDNADTRNKWLPDALAAAATDGCSNRRKLYTNAETVTMRANAWCIVTSANPTFASDAGLADRLLVVRMERSEGATSDGTLSDEIAAGRDAALSHIAQTIRAALADDAPTPPGLNQRHPDFAAFAVKLGRALGREAEAIAALQNAEADKSAFCVENDSIGASLKTYLDAEGKFSGTAAELLEKLRAIDPDLEGKSVKSLGKRLAKLWPHLQAIFSAKEDTGHGGAKVYRFKRGDFGDFQTGFSTNPPYTHARGLL